MRRRGVSLIELLVAVSLLGIVAVAVSNAYMGSIETDRKVRSSRTKDTLRRDFQDRVSDLLEGAYVTTASDDTASCFIGNTSSGSLGQSGSSGTNNLSGDFSNALVFTTLADRVPFNVMVSQDDFETQNREFGPQGGLAEVELSMVPVGTPQDRKGLYLREQRPADGDHTQGGYEQTLSADVTDIQFEFWDGSAWQTSWDTTTMGTRRLPGAVRVTYRMEGDDDDTIFVVRLPHSDATSTDPVTVTTS